VSERGPRGKTPLNFEIWYFHITFFVEKCFSFNVELVNWSFITVALPPGNNSLATFWKNPLCPPWKQSSNIHGSFQRSSGLPTVKKVFSVGLLTSLNYSLSKWSFEFRFLYNKNNCLPITYPMPWYRKAFANLLLNNSFASKHFIRKASGIIVRAMFYIIGFVSTKFLTFGRPG